jgi:hypothetical protein
MGFGKYFEQSLNFERLLFFTMTAIVLALGAVAD